MSYGPSVPDLFRLSATYVQKILQGTKPSDLPVEQPTKFEFIINLTTAKAVGLTIPAYTADFRYWHKADISRLSSNVRFWA